MDENQQKQAEETEEQRLQALSGIQGEKKEDRERKGRTERKIVIKPKIHGARVPERKERGNKEKQQYVFEIEHSKSFYKSQDQSPEKKSPLNYIKIKMLRI